MSIRTEFFLNSLSAVAKLELIEIAHPDFSQTFYICRNRIAGVTVTLDGATVQAFGYYPLSIKPLGVNDDMEQGFSVTVGDAGTVLPAELAAIDAADSFETKPTFRYWAYKSDDLTQPFEGPVRLEINEVTQNEEGFTFEARAPGFDVNKTGELYRIDRFPMLRGVL